MAPGDIGNDEQFLCCLLSLLKNWLDSVSYTMCLQFRMASIQFLYTVPTMFYTTSLIVFPASQLVVSYFNCFHLIYIYIKYNFRCFQTLKYQLLNLINQTDFELCVLAKFQSPFSPWLLTNLFGYSNGVFSLQFFHTSM